MAEIDEILKMQEKISDFVDDNFENEDVIRILSALSMEIVEVGYSANVSHEDMAQLFIGIINHHMIVTSGPTENDVIN